jgi:hypothetical protein
MISSTKQIEHTSHRQGLHLPMGLLPRSIGFSMTPGAESNQVLQSVCITVAGESVVGTNVMDVKGLPKSFFHEGFVRQAVLTDMPVSALGFAFLRLPVGPPVISSTARDEARMMWPFSMFVPTSAGAVLSSTLSISHCGCPKFKGLGASKTGEGVANSVGVRTQRRLVLTLGRTVSSSTMRHTRSNHFKSDTAGLTGNRNLVGGRHVEHRSLAVPHSHTGPRAVPCFGGAVLRNSKLDFTGRTANRGHGYTVSQRCGTRQVWRRCVYQTSA